MHHILLFFPPPPFFKEAKVYVIFNVALSPLGLKGVVSTFNKDVSVEAAPILKTKLGQL